MDDIKPKRFSIYKRTCKRCHKDYKTESKRSKVCSKCYLPKGMWNKRK